MPDVPYRDVAGMRVPLPMLARIVAACRDTYPQLTEGLSDDAAVQAVLLHWVTSTLAASESRRTAAPLAEVVESRQADLEAKAAAARQRALADAQAITPVPATDPATD